MATPKHPRPEGFTTNGGDFTYLRQLDGNLAWNDDQSTPEEIAASPQNDVTFDEADLSGQY